MTTTARQEIAKIREALDALERRLDAGDLEQDFGPAPTGADLDVWLERNQDALMETLREGDEQLARGEYREGTAAELHDYFAEKYRRRYTTQT
ncbi:hypothetical protein D3874_12130 [Oleomonas cavernae]|uniref:Uncharacterized protein n=1 Tax=Oleomonas cavernae TaxID=2320859 RepID=A0A418WCA6_9PROT|nr:hypothetical protein [Oleomonas cavernae]RJF87677.1 hypothetical protein D3874_12130 [Oleomonas cavernae]